MENILAKAVINTDTKGKCSGQRKKKNQKNNFVLCCKTCNKLFVRDGEGVNCEKAI